MFVVVWCLVLWSVCLCLCNVMWSELLMTSAIGCPWWSSVYEYQRVDCAIHPFLAKEGKLFLNNSFSKATHILLMELFPITTIIRSTHLLLQDDQPQQMECTDQLPTSSWYIRTHKEQLQRSLQSRRPLYKITLTL